MDVDTPGALLVQITDAARAAVDEKLPERTHAGRPPAGPVSDHQVSELQKLAPLVPLGQAQECVHADDETETSVRILMSQLGQGLDGVGGACLANLAIVDHESGMTLRGE